MVTSDRPEKLSYFSLCVCVCVCWTNLCNKNQLDALLFLSLFRQPANRQSTEKHNMYQLLQTHSIPPDDGLQICPKHVEVDFKVTLCINNIQHFNMQLMHTTLKNVELLKYLKISKTAPTCFGLQGNRHQGATFSTQLKITHLVKSRYVEVVQDFVGVMAAYCDL